MSDIFESELYDENISLSLLEDGEIYDTPQEEIVFDKPLFCLQIECCRENFYAKCENIEIQAGDYVLVQTRYGKDMAKVLGQVKKPLRVRLSDIAEIEKKAEKNDLDRAAEYKLKEIEAFNIFKEKVNLHKLNMKLIAVHFLIAESKVLFFFTSESRVDFRELVKDLVAIFKMRIELRQIGVRDEARITGGLGVCGRPFCCHYVSDKLKPVSIRMAKEQSLSLNSMKISGQCGRLLCCLSHEFDWYCEARKKLPPEGIHIFYDGTDFKIAESNPITNMIKMIGTDGRFLEVNAKRFVKNNNKWKIN